MATSRQILISADVLYDGHGKQENCTVVVEGGRIVDVVKKKMRADFRGFVTPAFIDAHSHIGMDREGEPWTESETNDILGQILPVNDPLNSIYFDDRAFSDAVDFGVLYSCVVPGSGNLLGGRARVIRNFSPNRKDAVVSDYGYKMALGFNPRSTTDWKGDRPNTRMGVYAMLEQKFDEVINKRSKAVLKKERDLHKLELDSKEKKLSKQEQEFQRKAVDLEYDQTFSPAEKAVIEILEGSKTAKVHVHKEDDVLYLIELAKKYGMKVTADHTCDVFHREIFDELGKAGIPVVYGPMGSVGYKVELKHAYYQNAALLMKSKAFYGLMTDHPVIWSPFLRDSLKFFLIAGMSPEEAISVITYRNAKILHLEDQLGSVEKGMTASLLVWDRHPLDLAAFPSMVMAEGRVIRKR
ncbi:MAG: amidohydrolase family protein [Candidatus Fermentibacteraceae bacterium]|nr:amidohydrolase family protein [Candidatus Fermentibacteraceae bacterium]MBN2607734.1 amidohydrolase family protein [Candidatus Fermentibacteraceae bacterium]